MLDHGFRLTTTPGSGFYCSRCYVGSTAPIPALVCAQSAFFEGSLGFGNNDTCPTNMERSLFFCCELRGSTGTPPHSPARYVRALSCNVSGFGFFSFILFSEYQGGCLGSSHVHLQNRQSSIGDMIVPFGVMLFVFDLGVYLCVFL